MTLKERMGVFSAADLYVVITEAFCAGRSPIEVLAGALRAGVRLVQLREKQMADKALYDLALKFRALTEKFNALLVIDDRIDVALAIGADGVHLGQNDLPIEAARKLGSELIIGCSAHSMGEAVSAQKAGASYVNIGPIFDTQTKAGVTGPLGPRFVGAAAANLSIPWTVMGGIKASNVDLVLERGARIIAVVTAVTGVEDVAAACAELRKKIRDGRKQTSQK
jgi:thiamine-phosphate pyrophosphorylase